MAWLPEKQEQNEHAEECMQQEQNEQEHNYRMGALQAVLSNLHRTGEPPKNRPREYMESLRAHHANMIGIVSLDVQVESDKYALKKWDKKDLMATALESNRFNMAGLAHHMDILALAEMAEIMSDKNTSDEDTTCNDAYTTCSACSASKQSAGLCEKCHKETIDYYKQGCGEQDEEREAEEETEDEE